MKPSIGTVLLIIIGAFLVGHAFASWDLVFGVIALQFARLKGD